MNFQTPQHSHQLEFDPKYAHILKLSESIMTQNKQQQITAFQELLFSEDTLGTVLQCIGTSDKVFFVTSELLLRMLKMNANELQLKMTNSLVLMMQQSFNLQDYKTKTIRMYNLIVQKYLQVLRYNIKTLQHHQYNQSIQILTYCLSELFNLSNEKQLPHINFISILFENYFHLKQKNMMSFLIDYHPFNIIQEDDLILPKNVELYQVLLKVISRVFELKENWEQTKYTHSEFFVNHRRFLNIYCIELADFAIHQAKVVFSIYLQQENMLFPHMVLYDVIKLLNQVILFSYESPHRQNHESFKQKVVMYPLYAYPEGILRSLSEDHTFADTLHKVYTKIIKLSQSQIQEINNSHNRVANDPSYNFEETHLQQMCSLILGIYGRIFFVKVDPNIHNSIVINQNQIQEVHTIPNYLQVYKSRIQILTWILENPEFYMCDFSSTENVNQRNNLYFVIVEIVNQFIIYCRPLEQGQNKINTLQNQIKSQIKQKMKNLLIQVIKFSQNVLNTKCWEIMYGDHSLGAQEIFTELRHKEILFPSKIFELLYQCHQVIEKKFFDPDTQITEIKQFYEKYFQITDTFLVKFQQQFTQNISKVMTDNFKIEHMLIKQIAKSIPYVRIKQSKVITTQQPFNHKARYFFQHIPTCKEQLTVLQYFQKFNLLIQNITQAIQQKISLPQTLARKNALSFFYYLLTVLIEHYLANANFYSKVSEALINVIRLMLKLTFEGSQYNSAASELVFYEQVVGIMSQSSLNSKELVEMIFKSELSSVKMLDKSTKNKLAHEKNILFIKNLMKQLCQVLVSKDIKEIEACFLVFDRIIKEFHRDPFVEQLNYLKEFILNYMNLPQSLFSQPQHSQKKAKLISLFVQFLQIPANQLTKQKKSLTLYEINLSCFAPFQTNRTRQNLIAYFQCMDKMIEMYETNRIFVIDMFLDTIKENINDINKNYRKLIKEDVTFYQTSKSLLLRILEVVQLFGGQKWGRKEGTYSESGSSNPNKLIQPQSDHQNGLFSQSNEFVCQQNQQDDEVPLKLEEYFYTWVKELGREEYQIQSCHSASNKQTHNKEIVAIYAQYLHLTTTGKVPPLPKKMLERERVNQLGMQLDKHKDLPPLEDFSLAQTKTTQLLINLYLDNLYRVSNETVLAVYPSIDYRLEYVKKWWDQVMVRGLRPQINVTFVYRKFVVFGGTGQYADFNRPAAELFFKIANYFKNDQDFINNYIQQPYRVRYMVVSSENIPNHTAYFLLGMINNTQESSVLYELKKDYVQRIVAYWQYGGQ